VSPARRAALSRGCFVVAARVFVLRRARPLQPEGQTATKQSMEPVAARHEAGLQVVDAQSGVRHHVDIPAGCRCGRRACDATRQGVRLLPSSTLTAWQPPAHIPPCAVSGSSGRPCAVPLLPAKLLLRTGAPPSSVSSCCASTRCPTLLSRHTARQRFVIAIVPVHMKTRQQGRPLTPLSALPSRACAAHRRPTTHRLRWKMGDGSPTLLSRTRRRKFLPSALQAVQALRGGLGQTCTSSCNAAVWKRARRSRAAEASICRRGRAAATARRRLPPRRRPTWCGSLWRSLALCRTRMRKVVAVLSGRASRPGPCAGLHMIIIQCSRVHHAGRGRAQGWFAMHLAGLAQ